jgi:hypothetical protein
MWRLVWMLMLAGLFAAIGCEQKPADRTPGKVTSEDVRRDAGQAAKTAAEYSRQTKEEFPKKLETQPADRTPGKVASEDVRHDAGQPVKAVSEYYQRTKDVFQKRLETQLDEMDAKIARLREKGRNLQTAAKANWDQKMAELDVTRDAARVKLDVVVHSNVEAWKDVQKGAEMAYDDLDQAFRNASKEF